MKTIFFKTPTQLSFIDLITMGDSEKRGSSGVIGVFGSGLKYSLALLLRNNVKFEAIVTGNAYIGGRDRDYKEIFTPYTYVSEDEITGKSKELIGINVQRDFESFNSIHCEDIFECEIAEKYETGFALQLGFNWELWMALREIYSNMLDEGGSYCEDECLITHKYGTVIKLTFEEGSEFDQIWQNRQNFIRESEWTWSLPNGIKVCENEDTWLKIYKNGILIHEDRDCQTNFSYQDDYAEIDERRLINNVYSSFNRIVLGIAQCSDKSLLSKLIVASDIAPDKFLEDRSTLNSWNDVSNEVFEVIDQLVEENGSFKTYNFLYDRVVKDDRYKHEGRVLSTITSSMYSYSKDVKVETTPQVSPKVKTKKEEIMSKYKLDFSEIEIKESYLSGSSCVADKFNKTIIIATDFEIEKHMADFIVQYYSIISNDNIIKSLSTKLEELLRK